jgi:GNAT superfamily N-acetyltransferase
MHLPDDLTLRGATLDDLPALASLREAAGWTVHDWALRAVIGVPHARFVVAVDDAGTVVASGSGISYGPLGFIGNMVVAEAHRRRGVGSAVLEAVTDFLEAAGCVRLELNATADGRPLYERHGFASIGPSLTARVPREGRLALGATIRVRHSTAGDLDVIAAYDLPRFGGDRRMLLAQLVADPEAPTLIAERDGGVAGFATIRDEAGGRIGPFMADGPDVAAAILDAAFTLNGTESFRVNLPPDNRDGAEWLRGLGVGLEAWDGRMARGAPIPKRPETMYGMAVGALG